MSVQCKYYMFELFLYFSYYFIQITVFYLISFDFNTFRTFLYISMKNMDSSHFLYLFYIFMKNHCFYIDLLFFFKKKNTHFLWKKKQHKHWYCTFFCDWSVTGRWFGRWVVDRWSMGGRWVVDGWSMGGRWWSMAVDGWSIIQLYRKL